MKYLLLTLFLFLLPLSASAQFNGCPAGFCSGRVSSGSGSTLSLDGSASNTGGTTTQTVTLSTTKTNDVIIVIATFNNSGGTISSISDTASLTWTGHRRATVTNGTTTVEEWYAISSGILTSDVITLNYSASASFSVATAFGVNGAHTAAPFDTNAAIPFTGVGTPSFTTSNANDFLVTGGANTCTPTSPWVSIEATSFWTVQYQIVSTTQSGSGPSCTGVNVSDAIIQGP